MFQLLKDPKFDFMSQRSRLLPLSGVLVVAAVVVLFANGLNLGIEFTGGTELQVRYAEKPDLATIRGALNSAGMTSQVVTTIGDPEDNEVYIRLGSQGSKQAAGEEEDPTAQMLEVLRRQAGAQGSRNDLNIVDQATLADLLTGAPGLGDEQVEQIAAEVLVQRKERAIFHSIDELREVPGVTPEVLQHLEGNSSVGPIALRSQSYIGPAVGRELVNKALWAIVGSLIGMLIYIWIRFQFQWGLAAVAALAHDTLLTLGLFSIFNQEMSLPVVAAFLTLIGYSVNDTVVVFDRIRENLQNQRSLPLPAAINLSINQTLSRTIITSGLTWIVVFGLFLFGGAALRPFSFVLSVGVLVGTYSSIFVASPILVLWKALAERRRQRAVAGKTSAERRTRKVRRSSTG